MQDVDRFRLLGVLALLDGVLEKFGTDLDLGMLPTSVTVATTKPLFLQRGTLVYLHTLAGRESIQIYTLYIYI